MRLLRLVRSPHPATKDHARHERDPSSQNGPSEPRQPSRASRAAVPASERPGPSTTLRETTSSHFEPGPMPVSPRRGAAAALIALAALAPGDAAAQRTDRPADVARIARDKGVRKALDTLKTSNAWTLDQQVSICEIPAPPFKERARGEELRRRFAQLGLAGVRIDSVGNVIGERAGRVQDGPTVVIAGHLDTVFPEGTDVKVKRDTAAGGARLTAPGIGDDCRGLAVLLAVARALDAAKVRT